MTTALSVWREHNDANNPASGTYPLNRADIQAYEVAQEAAIAALTAGFARGYKTKAAMDADTSQDDGALARVTNDTTPANNGDYIWDDGANAWVKATLQTVTGSALDAVSATVTTVAGRVTALEALSAGGRLTALEAADVSLDGRLDVLEAANLAPRVTTLETTSASTASRVTALEGVGAGPRLTALETSITSANNAVATLNATLPTLVHRAELDQRQTTAAAAVEAQRRAGAVAAHGRTAAQPDAYVTEGSVVVGATEDGPAYIITGPGAVRFTTPVPLGDRVVEAVATVRRTVAAVDPTGDAVALRFRWLGADQTPIVGAEWFDAARIANPGLGFLHSLQATAALAPGGAGYVAPITARFVEVEARSYAGAGAVAIPDLRVGHAALTPAAAVLEAVIGSSTDIGDRPASAQTGQLWALVNTGAQTATIYRWSGSAWEEYLTQPLTIGLLDETGLTAIGDFGADLIESETAAAARTALGISTFAATLLDDTTAGAMRTTLSVYSAAEVDLAIENANDVAPERPETYTDIPLGDPDNSAARFQAAANARGVIRLTAGVTYNIRTNVTIRPATTFIVEPGAKLSLAAGVILTAQSGRVEGDIDSHWILRADAVANVIGLQLARPEWWGADVSADNRRDDSDAVQAAINCLLDFFGPVNDTRTLLLTGSLYVDSPVVALCYQNAPFTVRGAGNLGSASGGRLNILPAQAFTANMSNGSNSLTNVAVIGVSGAANIAALFYVGRRVTGTGVPPGATVTAVVNDGTNVSLTLSANCTASDTAVDFTQLGFSPGAANAVLSVRWNSIRSPLSRIVDLRLENFDVVHLGATAIADVAPIEVQEIVSGFDPIKIESVSAIGFQSGIRLSGCRNVQIHNSSIWCERTGITDARGILLQSHPNYATTDILVSGLSQIVMPRAGALSETNFAVLVQQRHRFRFEPIDSDRPSIAALTIERSVALYGAGLGVRCELVDGQTTGRVSDIRCYAQFDGPMTNALDVEVNGAGGGIENLVFQPVYIRGRFGATWGGSDWTTKALMTLKSLNSGYIRMVNISVDQAFDFAGPLLDIDGSGVRGVKVGKLHITGVRGGAGNPPPDAHKLVRVRNGARDIDLGSIMVARVTADRPFGGRLTNGSDFITSLNSFGNEVTIGTGTRLSNAAFIPPGTTVTEVWGTYTKINPSDPDPPAGTLIGVEYNLTSVVGAFQSRRVLSNGVRYQVNTTRIRMSAAATESSGGAVTITAVTDNQELGAVVHLESTAGNDITIQNTHTARARVREIVIDDRSRKPGATVSVLGTWDAGGRVVTLNTSPTDVTGYLIASAAHGGTNGFSAGTRVSRHSGAWMEMTRAADQAGSAVTLTLTVPGVSLDPVVNRNLM